MGGASPLSGRKRSFPFGDKDRPSKRPRKCFDGVSEDEVPGESSLGFYGAVCSTLGSAAGGSALTFLDGQLGPSRDLDCSSLSEALSSDEFVPIVAGSAEEVIDDDLLLSVHVPGAASFVKVSYQFFIKQILRKLKLHLHGWGLVLDTDGKYTGWIDSDTPAVGVDGEKGREKFLGEECSSQYKAMESVAADAVEIMMKKYNVVVKDLNYNKVAELSKRLDVERHLSSALLSGLHRLELKEEKLREDCVAFFRQVEAAVHEFSYLLPVNLVRSESSSGGRFSLRAVYNGVRPPSSNEEMFASALVDVLQSGLDLFGDLLNG